MACLRAAERASGRWERRSLITSRDAPTTARWALTCLRRRVLACSCVDNQTTYSIVSTCLKVQFIPQKYPFGGRDGRERSTQCDVGSCAAGTATRSCRSGNGRSCCPSGRRACPTVIRSAWILTRCVHHSGNVRGSDMCQRKRQTFAASRATGIAMLIIQRYASLSSHCVCLLYSRAVSPLRIPPLSCPLERPARVCDEARNSYLSRVDLLAGEGIVVGPHFGVWTVRLCVG